MLIAFPLSAILLGLINIVIVAVILLLIGAVCQWLLGILGFPIPAIVVKLYLAIVALVVLYEIVALLFGLPLPRIVG